MYIRFRGTDFVGSRFSWKKHQKWMAVQPGPVGQGIMDELTSQSNGMPSSYCFVPLLIRFLLPFPPLPIFLSL